MAGCVYHGPHPVGYLLINSAASWIDAKPVPDEPGLIYIIKTISNRAGPHGPTVSS